MEAKVFVSHGPITPILFCPTSACRGLADTKRSPPSDRSRDSRQPPVILITGNADLHDMRKGMETDADDYLAKPAGLPILLETV
jgi:CheY-like chemotaxis protein